MPLCFVSWTKLFSSQDKKHIKLFSSQDKKHIKLFSLQDKKRIKLSYTLYQSESLL